MIRFVRQTADMTQAKCLHFSECRRRCEQQLRLKVGSTKGGKKKKKNKDFHDYRQNEDGADERGGG